MSTLRGRSILVVEDEAIIAMDVEATLAAAGLKIVGPAGSVAEALALVGNEDIDAALLDLNLDGETALPVADALATAGIPFVLVTGHGPGKIPPAHSKRPLLSKPYVPARLIKALEGALNGAAGPAHKA